MSAPGARHRDAVRDSDVGNNAGNGALALQRPNFGTPKPERTKLKENALVVCKFS